MLCGVEWISIVSTTSVAVPLSERCLFAVVVVVVLDGGARSQCQ